MLSGSLGALAELDPEGSPEFHGRVLSAIDKAARHHRTRHLLDPEEARQELVTRLLERPEQLREWSAAERACLERAATPEDVERCEDKSRALLWTVFHRRVVDVIRARHGRRRPTPAGDPEGGPKRGPEPRPQEPIFVDPEELSREVDARGQVARSAEDEYLDSLIPALPGISADEMRLLTLRHVYDWTAPELAAEVGITPAAMRERLPRAREKVRAAMSHSPRSVPMFVVEGASPETQGHRRDEDEDHGTADRRGEGAAA